MSVLEQQFRSDVSRAGEYGTQISVRNLSKAFGSVHVLHNINLDVASGEFVAIVGRSGCGKSTLLRLLSGLETPNTGEILLSGQPLQGLNTNARVMFQDSRLLPWQRVLDNVTLGLRRQSHQRGVWALQQVGLGDRHNSWITQLSGGQRQRVALARALVSQPQLLLLDEPLGALDALTRIEMQQLIQTLWQEQQFTAILVTHDVEEAIYLADRVIVLKDGNVDLDLEIDLPRPRYTGSAEFADLKTRTLEHILDVGAVNS
ncbi:MAG TPA: ATP-binding cassette domain-containing protein [Crinalium sp.]|jgi:sulfonate transport system ATP-binding protein